MGIDIGAVAKALGVAGRVNDGVYLVSVPRTETIHSGGLEIPASMVTLDDEPRLCFMHFCANDDAVRLAAGLRAALDRTNSKR